ncbi:MAG: cysteate synthase [Candidatus Methylomirabilia bacterium]
MSHFGLRCRKCAKLLEDSCCAFCEHCRDALLVSDYGGVPFSEQAGAGIWRFNWLPVHSPSFVQPGPSVYRSRGLALHLGLENLHVAFNGYWPEKGALLQTCTFKEFEAAVVLQNARENGIEGLIVASAGNTARSFAYLSAQTGYPLVIVVPAMCLTEMWYHGSSKDVPTVVVADGDYADSIDVARRIAAIIGYPFEGGVKNVAKRDGLGLVLLEAVAALKRLPDHYFQAVGSGTGAIGVWEMGERFLADGRFGSRLPVLHLAQNLPFAPMTKAWARQQRRLEPEDLRPALIPEITTRVLSTRYPAYTVAGGVYDALTATGGRMYGVCNEEVYAAMDLFRRLEGVDIVPAAGVALAALKQAVAAGVLRPDEAVLLNVTGGGEKNLDPALMNRTLRQYVVSKAITDKEIEELLCPVLNKSC